ncbi:MAG: tetratricopeptide repeat protein, partial [Muribaculaceae bacterium]|nr:tetratricopeptide repeat protein [Muribaculaceae bacterium]
NIQMKFKFLFAAALLAGASFSSFAQTHVEGEEYYKADQLNNAKELLLRNMNNSGTNKAVSDFYLGLISLQEGKQDEALKYFNEGIQNNPDYAYNYVGLGIIDLKKGDKKAAETQFKIAESKEKKSPELQINIARAYYNTDPVAYAKDIEKRINNARKFNMKDESIYIFEGDVKKDAKDFGGAAAKYEMATTYNPDATPAYVKYANLFTMVNPEYAIKMLNNLLEKNPDSALGQRELANAYYNAGKYKEAAEQYSKYVKNPNHFKQDENRYAFLLFYGGDYQQGYDYSTSLLKQDPKNFTAQRYQFMNAAQIKDMQNQLLPMAEALVASHKADPANNKFAPIDYNLITSELNAAKRPQEAQALLEEAIKENPTNRDFYKQLAMTFVEENNLSKAVDAYEGYLENSEKPGYNDFIQQATFAFYAGVENKANPTEADKYYTICQKYADKAAEILPDNYKPKKFAGDIARQKATEAQAPFAAVPAYTEALTLLEASENPSRYATDAKEMYNYMGNSYLEQKNVAKAKEYFNKYLNFDPNNENYRKFVEGLK